MSSPEACVLLSHTAENNGVPYSTQDLLVHFGSQVAARAETPGLSIVIRPGPPSPSLAALGELNAQVEALERLSQRLVSLLDRARFIRYDQIERDCDTLAQGLTDCLGDDVLGSAHFVGIPRGGLVVLGMLSYALDLDHAQLEQPSLMDGPLVVFDDCALTGSRFRRFLQQWPDRKIIFAPLYAHPELCAAIEDAEPRVTACVHARNLHDYAPDDLGDDYPAWQAQWHDRHPDERYWIGRTEHLCFPWGEVDTATWDAEQEEVVQGLSVVPPEHRLKRHSNDEAHKVAADSVQVQPEPAGPIRPVSSVFFGTVDDRTIVANPDVEVCVEFDGTAAAMWHALIEQGTVEDTLEALLDMYSVDRATLRADLLGFMEQLAANDLLHVPDGAFL